MGTRDSLIDGLSSALAARKASQHRPLLLGSAWLLFIYFVRREFVPFHPRVCCFFDNLNKLKPNNHKFIYCSGWTDICMDDLWRPVCLTCAPTIHCIPPKRVMGSVDTQPCGSSRDRV